MSILDSTFNCSNCSKKLWLKYYKLPDRKIVCPKCFDIYKNTEEIEKQMNKNSFLKQQLF